MTADQVRKLGAKYLLNISGVVGTTTERVVALIACGAIALILSWFFVGILTTILDFDTVNSGITILLVWLACMVASVKLWVVNVPKLTGLITTNYFTGELHVFSWGSGIKYPWEHYTLDDYISVQADTLKKETRFISKDGIAMTIEWTLQYTPWMPLLPLFIRTDTEAVYSGLTEIAESTLSHIILGKSVKQAREPATNDQIRGDLTKALEGQPVQGVITRDAQDSSIEERFGLRAELGTLSPPVFSKEYEQAMVASAARRIMSKDAHALTRKTTTWTGMSADRALTRVMIMNKEPGIKEDVFTLQADDAFTDAIQALGPAVVAGLATAARATRNRSGTNRNPRGKTP